MGSEPIHLRPAVQLAPRVLLPGDPHRALAVAQEVLDEPKMFNHARGLWGYTGVASDGQPMSIQATGMGGPSAAIVVEELIALGARELVRIGTCGALVEGLALGSLVAAETVIGADGASRALAGETQLRPDPELHAALVASGARAVTAVSTDLFYDTRDGLAREWVALGAEVVEMEAAALLAIAGAHGVKAAVVLAVSDELAGGGRTRLGREALDEAGLALGRSGAAALARPER